MYILGFLFIFIIFIFVLGLSIIGNILRAVFGFGRRSSSSQSQHTYATNREESSETTQEAPKHKKLFDKDEGEYVDFEEVKESKE